MQTDDLVIRAKTLSGVWNTYGVDQARGIVPESVVLTANLWGSDTASFDLRRDPRVPWQDLVAFTPVEVEVAGTIVWTGRVKETPGRDGEDPVINVQCEGWQYHLDDDSYVKAYVHSTIADWRDTRTFPDANLTANRQAGMVSSDDGAITLGFPYNQSVLDNTWVGVTLDLGPYNTAASISIDYESSANHTAVLVFARAAGSVGSFTSTFADASSFSGLSLTGIGASGTMRGTFATAYRYVQIFLYVQNGGTLTPAADYTIKLKGIRVFTNDAYRSTDASILKASDVVNDALTQATALISSDRTKISATSFNIPDFHFELEPRTPREAIDAVNAFHNYIAKVDVDQRMVFSPRPTVAAYEIGSWGGSTFEDSSMNAGEDVYSRVTVTGTGPDGTALIVPRSAGDLPSAVLIPSASPVPDNPSFDVNATSWTGATRDTGVFNTSPAGGYVNASASETFTGTFLRNTTYVLKLWLASGTVFPNPIRVTLGTATDFVRSYFVAATWGTGGTTVSIAWTPTANRTGVTLGLIGATGSGDFWVDTLKLYTTTPTVVQRQGFTRTKILPISASLTATVAQQIGDTYLASHLTQPLRGGITATSGGIRRVLTSQTVHPAHMLRETQQLIRLGHRIDPDTGGIGRDGMIASVTYTHDSREAQISLDSDRHNYEALLSRFSLLSS